MTESNRTRALSKPVWLLVVLVVPLVGPALWILFGKGLLLAPIDTRPSAPDDDKAFLDAIGTESVHDERIRQLEAELRALDDQIATGDVPREPKTDDERATDEPRRENNAPASSGDGHDDDDEHRGNGPNRA